MVASALNKNKGGVSVPGMGRRSPTWRTEGAESLQGRSEMRRKTGSAGGWAPLYRRGNRESERLRSSAR